MAQDEFRKALDLNPSYANAHLWYSRVLRALGEFQQALDELRRADEADPLSIVILANERDLLAALGRKEEAEKKLKKMLEIDPDNLLTKRSLSASHYLNGDYEQSIRILLQASELERSPGNPGVIQSLAITYAATGDMENAMKWLRKLISLPEETQFRALLIANVYAALGDFDKFFLFANRAFKEKTLVFEELRLIDEWIRPPRARKIRDDPRFSELFRRAGLKPESDTNPGIRDDPSYQLS